MNQAKVAQVVIVADRGLLLVARSVEVVIAVGAQESTSSTTIGFPMYCVAADLGSSAFLQTSLEQIALES
jgi:hypothetical protein